MLAYIVVIEPGLVRQPDFAANLATHLLFIHNWWPLYHGAIDGPNWSLGAEMQFYLLMAVSAPWFLRMSPWRLLFGMVAISWLWRWAMFNGALGVASSAVELSILTSQLPGTLDRFAFGIILARFVLSEPGKQLLDRLARSGKATAWGVLGTAALSFYVTMSIFFANAVPYWSCVQAVTATPSLLALNFTVLLFATCAFGARAPRLLAPVNYLGRISYGLYLWHLPVLMVLKQQSFAGAPGAALAVALPVTVMLAALSWHFFERPILEATGRPRVQPVVREAL